MTGVYYPRLTPESRAKHAASSRVYRLAHPERQRCWQREHHAKRRAFIAAFKAEHGCVDCGERDPVVLDLDHRDPATKHPRLLSPERGELSNLALRDLLAELALCDVRCANCHRRRTHRERHR